MLSELIFHILDLLFQFGDYIVESLFLILVYSLFFFPIFLDFAVFSLKFIYYVLPLEPFSLETSLSLLQIFLEVISLILSLCTHIFAQLYKFYIFEMFFFKKFDFVFFQLVT